MGTKLQFPHNLLASSHTRSFSANQLDYSQYLGKNKDPKRKLDKRGLTDRMLEPHHIEFIKRKMLCQENIFQHQVRELHRLYSVERMLMNKLKNESSKQTPFPKSKADIYPRNLLTANPQIESAKEMDQSLGEHSGSCSGEMLKIPKGFDLERPAQQEEDMSTGVSATDKDQNEPSTDTPWKSGCTSIEANVSDIELTLSLGGSSFRKRSESEKNLKLNSWREANSSPFIKGEELCDSNNTPKASSSKEDKQTHWIFQDLSLSRT